MKEKLMKLLAAKQEQRKALNDAMINSDNKEDRAEIGETLRKLEEEIKEVESLIAEADEPVEPNQNDDGQRFKKVGSLETRTGNGKVDIFDTEEYNNAFMEFVCRGKAIPAEYRVAAKTTTTDASAAIPTTMLKEIMKEIKSYGSLYNAVRKLNVQGGVNIPILSLKPTATWIGETTPSEDQKIQANTNISFSYFGLECKISQTLLVNVVTLQMFQDQFVPLAVEAIVKALDLAIMNGSGTNQPTGVTKDSRVPSGNIITLASTDFVTWEGWKKKVFAKMKKSYRNGTFYMAQSTFDGYVDGMVDSNGQPIGRVNYGITGAETYRFGGKVVETVEDDVIKGYDDATTGDVVAVFLNPKDYAINSNLEMKTVKWTDNDTNEVKNKVILIVDGKLVDPNGVIIVKKGA